jgi:hypothetical protein
MSRLGWVEEEFVMGKDPVHRNGFPCCKALGHDAMHG